MHKGFKIYEPVPADERACKIALFVTRSAEWGATSARKHPTDSVDPAFATYEGAENAADVLDDDDTLAQLHESFTVLCRVAAKGCWSDGTPVPPSVFDLLADEPPERPWWKLWR